MELSWKPRRRGSIYCSPGCGGEAEWGCTWAKYQQAIRKAKALAAKLGPGWKANVWENMGWHYAAISSCRRVKVHPGAFRGYHAFVGRDTSPGGEWVAYDKTPKRAVEAACRMAQGELLKMSQLLQDLPKIAGR